MYTYVRTYVTLYNYLLISSQPYNIYPAIHPYSIKALYVVLYYNNECSIKSYTYHHYITLFVLYINIPQCENILHKHCVYRQIWKMRIYLIHYTHSMYMTVHYTARYREFVYTVPYIYSCVVYIYSLSLYIYMKQAACYFR